MTVSGKALVTGASSGIGMAYARALARRGVDLVLVARDAARLEALAAELRGHGVSAQVVSADLADAAALARVADLFDRDAAITILVNNAGIALLGGILTADLTHLDDMIALNVRAATRLAIAAARAFAPRRCGIIINIASAVAVYPDRFNAAYSGTKSHLLAFSRSLAEELAPHGLTVQAVLPGVVRTAIWERAGRDPATLDPGITMDADEMVEAALAGLALGETVTIPSLPDIADWERHEAARLALAPNLSRAHAAARYRA